MVGFNTLDFTYYFKMDFRATAGSTPIREASPTPATVFETELLAICEEFRLLKQHVTQHRNIVAFADSQWLLRLRIRYLIVF